MRTKSSKDLNIGIVGVGMVGGAIARYFEKVGRKSFLYDNGKNFGSIEEINQADIIFICVPTPFNKENNYFDKSYLEEAFSKIGGEKIIVIKSTILPGTTEYFQEKYPQHKVLFNPEFLTEHTADQDMQYPDRQIIGYTKKSYNVASDILQILPLAPYEKIMPATEAEMVKYFGNTWFANKVVFANQMYDLCQKLGIDYDRVMEASSADKRIGKTHLEVWHKGYRGYGGKCLEGNEIVYEITENGLRIIPVKNFHGNKILTVREGKLQIEEVLAKGQREIKKTIKFYLSKGRELEVSPDHLMVVFNEKKGLLVKEARKVSLKDGIPIVMDLLPVELKNVNLNFFENFSYKEEVFTEEIDKIYVNQLKPYLTFHQYKGFKRERKTSLPAIALVQAQISLDSLKIKTGKTGSWIPATFRLDDDFARLIGYYLSEGCSSDERVFFSFGYHERELIEDLISILNKFDIKFSTKVGWWEGHKSNFTIKVSSRILSEYFKKYCGKNCYSKKIPEYLFFTSPSIKNNFLKGLFSGDGSQSDSNMGNYYIISYASASKELIEGIDLLLREKGILAGRKIIFTKKSKVPVLCLLISETQAIEKLLPDLPALWQKKIKISAKYIQSPAYQRINENLAILKIKKIEKLKESKIVYSLETKNGYYLTTGGILTHNCLPKDMKAFIRFAEEKGVDLKLHKVVDEINDKLLDSQGITDPEKFSKRD